MKRDLTKVGLALIVFASQVSVPAASAVARQDLVYCHSGSQTNLIFVDRTTRYDERDKRIFTAGIGKIVDKFQIGDRVVVATIGGSHTESERTFDQCVPGCPESGVVDWFIGKCRPLQARADLTNFRRHLAGNIKNMLDDIQEYRYSDIAGTIARTTYGMTKSQDDDSPDRLSNIFVFSDMVENSINLPWPKVLQDSAIATVEKLNKDGVRPDLQNSRVFVFGFGRFHDKARRPLRHFEERGLREFWSIYFERAGAANVFIGDRLN